MLKDRAPHGSVIVNNKMVRFGLEMDRKILGVMRNLTLSLFCALQEDNIKETSVGQLKRGECSGETCEGEKALYGVTDTGPGVSSGYLGVVCWISAGFQGKIHSLCRRERTDFRTVGDNKKSKLKKLRGKDMVKTRQKT